MRFASMLVLVAATATAAPQSKLEIAVCSPGAVGTQADAQPALDAFANAISSKAGVPVGAVFEETEAAGVARLKEAGLALVSLPFFLAHEKDLALHARLTVVQQGRPDLDKWTLVAKKGRVPNAGALAGLTIYTNTAFAPAFVKGTVLGGFGAVPATTKLVQSSSVLSALRRAANGEPVAVLLDGAQQASLASLPYASQLETVATSPAMPAGVIATVDARVPAPIWQKLDGALRALPADQLAAVRLAKFVPLDDKALDAARKAFAGAR
jgi:ABC-type phosphate/phosphonate transport system substrate-binding protein